MTRSERSLIVRSSLLMVWNTVDDPIRPTRKSVTCKDGISLDSFSQRQPASFCLSLSGLLDCYYPTTSDHTYRQSICARFLPFSWCRSIRESFYGDIRRDTPIHSYRFPAYIHHRTRLGSLEVLQRLTEGW